MSLNKIGIMAVNSTVLMAGNSTAVSLSQNSKPNVVLFYLDDSGYGDFSHNGNPTISTPNITKLTQDGISFSQFYVPTAACTASRYSLLTGRYPSRSGLGAWVIGPKSPRYLHPKELTIADQLKKNGYQTAIFGKWHLGTPNKNNNFTADAFPLAHGFDQWLGTNVSHDYDTAMLIKSDPHGTTPTKGYTVLSRNLPSQRKVCESLTERYTQSAIHFINQNKDKPFFTYIAYNMPHLGLYVSDKFKGTSRRGLLGDCMQEIDDSVGQVRQAIEKAGLTKNTIIIFSSDNGPWILFQNTRQHPKYGEARLNVGYALPFKDGKGSTWEGGHRVPGIIVWPGTIPQNKVEQTPISTLDILPTLLQLTHSEIITDRILDGRDISSLLIPSGSKKKMLEPFKFFYHHSTNKPFAIRLGPWKMHVKIGSQLNNKRGMKASREKPLLFQVEQDLSERFDRAEEHPELIKTMMREFEAYEADIKKTGDFWFRVNH